MTDEDQYQFQWWALRLVGARPVEQKKGADKGIDGRLPFNDSSDPTDVKHVMLSVKSDELLTAQFYAWRNLTAQTAASLDRSSSMIACRYPAD